MKITLENKSRFNRLTSDLIYFGIFIALFVVVLNRRDADTNMIIFILGILTVFTLLQMFTTNTKLLKKLVYEKENKELEMTANLKFGDAKCSIDDIVFIDVIKNNGIKLMNASGKHFLFIKYKGNKTRRFDIFDDENLKIAREMVEEIKVKD